jgi:hypothetical protein
MDQAMASKAAKVWSISQKQAGTLDAPTRCACCMQRMDQGQPFAWVEVRTSTGAKVSAGVKTKYRTGHINKLCGMVDLRLWEAKRELESAIYTLNLLKAEKSELLEATINMVEHNISELEAEIRTLPNYIF